MEPPHPYWAHHNHSDEHLNLLFAPYPQESEPQPPHPYWTDPDHDPDQDRSDEHLNLVYPTVRQQRLLNPPSPDDSGYSSPSETRWRTRRWKLRVVNTTPPPPSPPPPATTTSLLFAEDGGDEGSRRAHEWDLSSGWSASSSADSVTTIIPVKTEEKNKKNKNKKKRPGEHPSAHGRTNNICTRALRTAARKCIGNKIPTAKRKTTKTLSPSATGSSRTASRFGLGTATATGTGTGTGTGSWGAVTDGAKQDEEKDPSAGNKKRVCGRWVRVGVLERIRRTLLRKEGPVELRRAEVRFPLD